MDRQPTCLKSNMNTVSFPLDPYSWELSLFYDDGKCMETIHGNDGLTTYEVPAAIYDFVKKVMDIGGMDTEKQRLF